MDRVLPVTLLTGFLGSGKTTLLNHLLTQATETRFCVVENEFGTVGIDADLVDSNAKTVVNLNEGCVCCTVRDDLVAVFDRLASQRDDFDHVIIEASGLADPGPVMQVIERQRGRFRLHGVVAVVDAAHAELDRAENPTWTEQLTFADVIVLNKVSSATQAAVSGLADALATLNPVATQVRADHARIDITTILSLDTHDPARIPTTLHHHHDRHVGSVVVQVDGDLDLSLVDVWLGSLLRHDTMSVVRMKGFLALSGHEERFIFHAVRAQVDVRPGPLWAKDVRRSRVVFIGRNLDDSALQAGLAACTSNPSSQRTA